MIIAGLARTGLGLLGRPSGLSGGDGRLAITPTSSGSVIVGPALVRRPVAKAAEQASVILPTRRKMGEEDVSLLPTTAEAKHRLLSSRRGRISQETRPRIARFRPLGEALTRHYCGKRCGQRFASLSPFSPLGPKLKYTAERPLPPFEKQ